MIPGVTLEPPVHASPGPSSGSMPPILGRVVITTVLAGGVGALIIEGVDAPTGVLTATNLLGVPVAGGVGLGGGALVEADGVVTIL